MSMHRTIATFGRTGPTHQQGIARTLGAAPAAPPAAPPAADESCSVKAWYDDPPRDLATGKATGGMATSTMAYLVMGVPAAVGLALGAVLCKNSRVLGGAIGAVAGFAAGAGVTTYEYTQWKNAGGSKHTKGACDAPAAAAAPAAAPTGEDTGAPSGGAAEGA